VSLKRSNDKLLAAAVKMVSRHPSNTPIKIIDKCPFTLLSTYHLMVGSLVEIIPSPNSHSLFENCFERTILLRFSNDNFALSTQ
jgi:hypothetical protein